MSRKKPLHEYVYTKYGTNEYSGLIIPLLVELDWGKKERIRQYRCWIIKSRVFEN